MINTIMSKESTYPFESSMHSHTQIHIQITSAYRLKYRSYKKIPFILFFLSFLTVAHSLSIDMPLSNACLPLCVLIHQPGSKIPASSEGWMNTCYTRTYLGVTYSGG